MAAEWLPGLAGQKDRTWSVALSGGGHRAAMFGLGAMLYLVDAGVGPKVTSIASVSGGSLTNALLAQHVDLKSANKAEVVSALGPLIARCARGGTVLWARETKTLVRGLKLTACALAGSLVRSARHPSVRAFTRVGVAAAAALAVFNRSGAVAEKVFSRMFFAGPDGGRRSVQLRALSTRVTHVFCATDLRTGAPIYFAPRFAWGTNVGLTTSPTISLERAVQLSANFPLFAARRFRSHTLGFTGTPDVPMLLTDGGVFDNMADDWARRYWERGRDAGEQVDPVVGTGMGEIPQQLLVVNGSASLKPDWSQRWFHLPLLDLLWAFFRDGQVLFDQTTAARRHGLIELFDLAAQMDAAREARSSDSASPAAVYAAPADAQEQRVGASGIVPPLRGTLLHLDTPATWPVEDGYSCPRVVQPEWFASVGAEIADWAEREDLFAVAASNALVPTTLGELGSATVVDLLWHGYMLAMVNFRVFFRGEWMPQPRADFARIVDEQVHGLEQR